jgi:hypothetical protein
MAQVSQFVEGAYLLYGAPLDLAIAGVFLYQYDSETLTPLDISRQ